MKTVLVTGGFGFLGRAVARRFKAAGCRVVGIGRGRWAPEEALAADFDVWLDAGVSVSSLMTFKYRFDTVVHCGGNGSVGYSITNPLQDFYKTVQGTAELLEYLRLQELRPVLIYPSSAGVYGAKEDHPIREADALNPISAYGYHKRMAEHLLEMHSKSHGVRIAVVRFFSIYGPGLTKQLLWDASSKLQRITSAEDVVFWGTGEETRDWIESSDAANLIYQVSEMPEPYAILNGASGIRTTVRETLELLRRTLDSPARVTFNGLVREGDPRFYHADISRSLALGWRPEIDLAKGIRRYVEWIKDRN